MCKVNPFPDEPHFQVAVPYTLAQAAAKFKENGTVIA